MALRSIYLAGPMKGIPHFNFPLFDEAANALRRSDWHVVNPAEHDRETYPDIACWPGFATGDTSICPKFDRAAVMRWDLQSVLACDAIALLPGWQTSTGARTERYVAETSGRFVYELLKGREPDVGWVLYASMRRMLATPQLLIV